jgi:hypothetical protein
MTNPVLDAVQQAWLERQRRSAQTRIVERALGRAALTAARADRTALLQLPIAVLSDPLVRGALDAARLNPTPPHLHDGRWELADVIDLYAAGRLEDRQAVEILASWPYLVADPHRDEAQPWADSFAVVDAASDTGLLSRPLVQEVRQRRLHHAG